MITSPDPVHLCLKQLGLGVLKQARDAGIGGAQLGQLPAERVLDALVLPQIARLAMLARDNPSSKRLEAFGNGVTAVVERSREAQRNRGAFLPEPLTVPDQLPGFFAGQESQIVADVARVHAAWRAGIELLETVVPELAARVRDAVILMAGLDGPFGEVTAFSSPSFPGCIAFGINSPPAVLAEEILHEASHAQLWARLAVDRRLYASFSDLPAIHSPFTDSLRPAMRVLHGFVSYAAVVRYWQALKGVTHDPTSFGDIPESRAAALINRRIHVLSQRLATALAALGPVIEDDRTEAFEAVVKDIVGCELKDFCLPKNQSGAECGDGDYDAVLSDLPPISLAEYNLASVGAKVSRMALPVTLASRLARASLGNVGLVASGNAVRSHRDPRLGNFSNIAFTTVDLLDAGPDDDVYLYLSSDPRKALAAWCLDQVDEAGELFGIPSCCARFFHNNWEESRTQTQGDLFETLLVNSSSGLIVSVHWACNAAAMYFGSGLCWHFPCALDCPATISVIAERRQRLAKIDHSLTQELVVDMSTPLVWDKGAGYGRLPSDGGLSTPVDRISWLNSETDHALSGTVATWLSAVGESERKLIIPTLVEGSPIKERVGVLYEDLGLE